MAVKSAFLDEIQNNIIIGDGAISSELQRRHVIADGNAELLNIYAPDSVCSLHAEYVAAGSRILDTNTFGANRYVLTKINNEPNLRNIIMQGTHLARKAAKNDTYISGLIGPLPNTISGYLDDKDRISCYTEQISYLLETDIDLISCKTFYDLSELKIVVSLIRSLSDIPIAAYMTFERSGLAADGSSANEFADECICAGASVMGVNCGHGAQSILNAINSFPKSGIPIGAYINAGFPEWIDGELVYNSSPEYIASLAINLIDRGVKIIGGCCGTSPEFIKAITDEINKKHKSGKPFDISFNPLDMKNNSSDHNTKNISESSRIIVQLDPPTNFDQTPIIDASMKLRESGITRISVSDNCLAEVHTDALTTAGIIARSTGLDITLHLTCRDRNRLAIQSTLMGAQALGIKSILCLTGVPISMCRESNTSGVFDMNSVGLIKLISEFNTGKHGINRKTSFEIGAAVNPNVRNIDSQMDKLKRKIDSGATFALSQPIFTSERTMIFREALDRYNIIIPIYMAVMPLTSIRNAIFVHNEVPGVFVPIEVREYLQKFVMVSDQRNAMNDMLLNLIDEAYTIFKNFYVIAPRNNAELVLPIITKILSKFNNN